MPTRAVFTKAIENKEARGYWGLVQLSALPGRTLTPQSSTLKPHKLDTKASCNYLIMRSVQGKQLPP